MVYWNDKERGIRMEDCHGVRGLYLGCASCHRSVSMPLGEAKRRFAGLYLREIARRLLCSCCGKREGYVMILADSPQSH